MWTNLQEDIMVSEFASHQAAAILYNPWNLQEDAIKRVYDI